MNNNYIYLLVIIFINNELDKKIPQLKLKP